MKPDGRGPGQHLPSPRCRAAVPLFRPRLNVHVLWLPAVLLVVAVEGAACRSNPIISTWQLKK